MNHPVPSCSKCNQSMQAGFMLDRTYGANVQSVWTPGEPHVYKMFGMSTGTLQIDEKQTHPVTCYRCPACSYLEFYAYPPTDAEAESMLLRAAHGTQQAEAQQLLRGSASPEDHTDD